MNKRLLNILTIFLAVLIIIVGIFIIWFYYNNQVQECTSNPLVYGAKQLKESYGYEFIGSGQLLVEGSPIYYFDSKNISIRKIR